VLGDGTCAPGSGRCPDWVDGIYGKSLYFDGNDDYVRVTNYVNEISHPSEITYEALVNLNSFTDSQHIVGWWWTDSTGIFVGTDGIVYFGMYEPFGCVHPGCTHRIAGSTNAINWNEWNFIAASYDDSKDEVTLVVNGKKNTVSFPYSPHEQPGYSVAIGKTTSGYPDQYPRAYGVIDEVRVYNKAIY